MNTHTLGIDLAKLSFVAALRFGPQRLIKAEFENHLRGFQQLRTWLKRHGAGRLRVGLESTNVYGEALAQWLYDEGHEVYLLNPERTACYARSCGQRNKTDPADAVTVAAFIAQHEATPWQPPPPEQKTLRSLTRVRHQLITCQQQLTNQWQTAAEPARQHLAAMREALRRQIATVGREIARHLRAHPLLGEHVRRLMTIKGIGLVTAATALAELPPITSASDPRAICAWAGLTPRRWQSGKLESPTRLSRKGNAYLRQALYMPALVAKRWNPVIRAFAARLSANGKSTPAILGAISHKLLRIIVGLLRSNSDFDPNWSPQKS